MATDLYGGGRVRRKRKTSGVIRPPGVGVFFEADRTAAALAQKERDAAALRQIAQQQERQREFERRFAAGDTSVGAIAPPTQALRKQQQQNVAKVAEFTRRFREGIPLPGDSERRADLLRIAQGQKYARQQRFGEGGVERTIRDATSLQEIAEREGLSMTTARKRRERAERMVAGLKRRYRRNDLFAGDASGTFDPLLENAYEVRNASTPEAQDAAIARYAERAKGQGMLQIAGLRKRAASAQKQMRKDLREATKALESGVLDEETEQFIQQMLRIANDGFVVEEDPDMVLASAAALRQFIRQNKESDVGGWRGVLKDVTSAPVIGTGIRALGVPIEELVMQPLYASQRAARQGGGTGRQLASGISAFPGLGFLAGGVSARDRRETDTPEERQALADAGQLSSIGQRLAGALLGRGEGASMGGFGLQDIEGPLSGGIDFGIQAGADPLNVAGAVAAGLGRVGRTARTAAAADVARSFGVSAVRTSLSDTEQLIEAATRKIARAGNLDDAATEVARQGVRQQVQQATTTARLGFLDNTRRGRALVGAVEDLADEAFDAAAVQRAVPGLNRRAAAEIAEAGSKSEAVEAFKRAFASGEYDPQITFRRAALGKRGITAPGGVGLGGRVVRSDHGIFDLLTKARSRVRPTSAIRSTARTSSTKALQTQTLRSALARAGVRLGDAYDSIASEVMGLGPVERLDRVWEQIEGDAALENLFETNLKRVEKDSLAAIGAGDSPTLKHLQQAMATEDFEGFMRQMEVLGAIADGRLGAEAKAQAIAEAKFGMKRKFVKDDRLLNQALKDTATGLPAAPRQQPGLSLDQKVRFLDARIRTAGARGELPGDVQEALLRELARKAGLKRPGLGLFERKVEAVLANDVVKDELARLLRQRSELTDAVEDALPAAGLWRRLSNQPLKLVNSLVEPVSPARVAFLGYTNDAIAVKQRVEDLDRYAMELGFDDLTRSTIRQSVERIRSEDDLFRTVDSMLQIHARRSGVPEQLLLGLQAEGVAGVKKGSNRINFARVADGVVKADSAVHTLAQRGEIVYLPDPDDIRRTIREYRAFAGSGMDKFVAKARVGLTKPLDMSLFGIHGPFTHEELTIRRFLQKGHRTWKYVTVIPGTQLAALGAVVGFTQTEGDFKEKLKGAGQAASIGLLSPLRYIVRVPGIEEGMRKYLVKGFTPEVWKPHFARWSSQVGLDRPFTQYNAVKAGDPIGLQHQRLLETVRHEWDTMARKGKPPVLKLFRKDTRFLDGYSRILNNQIHPETDAVAEMFLRRQAGELADTELAQEYARFIDTDAGKLWMRRMKGAAEGPKNAEQAFARYDEFIRTYVADADVARARLDAAREFAETGKKVDVARDVLKASQRAGKLPEAIHIENVFRIPRNFQDVAVMRDRLTSKFGFEGPTTALNRIPLAKSIYRDEYTRLLREGVAPARAQGIAEEVAVSETNRIMFRIDDESRFAAKSDYVFPFQQPREELLRVWVPTIAQNKARALHMARLAAVAFNNGQQKGLFQEDRYGEWTMTVPGSAFLSKALFGSTSEFNFRLTDLVFFGQGAYGVNIIPSPGGPYWNIAARMFLNRSPESYENLPWAVREWLTPYGANGRIFRPEVSRMWQAWTGEPAPFEFASKQEQMNALNRHRIQVKLQLIWQHQQAHPDDLDWRPTDAEVDEATSASLKAWAFIGATFPASPGFLRPDQDALDAATARYTDAAGRFDFIRFINENPRWAPWMIGQNITDNESFEEWARPYTAEQSRMDTTTHKKRVKTEAEWSRELKERDAEAKAYKELSEIADLPAHLQADHYDAWNEKYPDLADRSRDTYQRDIELMHIEGSLVGAVKDEALNKWRKRYDVSFSTYQHLAGQLRRGALRSDFNPFDQARASRHIVKDVQKQLRRTQYADASFEEKFAAERRITAGLPVAEQVKYWQERIDEADFGTSDPGEIVERYKTMKSHLNSLYQTAPMKLQRAMNPKETSWYAEHVDAIEGDYRSQISQAYDKAFELDAIADDMNAKEQWGSTYNAIRKRSQAFFDLANELKNKWYKSIPDLEGMFDEARAVSIFSARGNKKAVAEIQRYRNEWGWFLPSDEESSYRAMPNEVQDAYVNDLVESLNIDPTAFSKDKLFFTWLTDFQKDLVRKNMPADKVAEWEAEQPAKSGSKGKGKGFRKFRYGSGSRIEEGELAYAFAMFEQYNKRGGAKAPPAYKEYLALPNDAALRSAFLKQHPEVAKYISMGPMANMPPVIAMLVADIMIRYGRWDGETRSVTEISEIGFAREMLSRWNRRAGKQAPNTYETWVNMPTGVAKAEYIKAHPEIQEWIQLGPMSNMPDAYREVVRDIMTRYGIWTAGQDPLGKVISGYYSTPSYARDQYLAAHPELVEYWKATRDPEESHFYNMADHYFSIADPTAKRMYLQVHPELQQWFLHQRQQRYENFLNQVAVYMGSNPELFTKYLERQEDILSDILHKFSQAPMVREQFVTRGEKPQKRRERD